MLAVCPLTTAATKSDTLISTRARSPGSAGMGRPLNSKSLRRKQAQAMLDLFEADYGRTAVTLDEIKKWASAQQDDELQLRVERLVSQCDGHSTQGWEPSGR